MTFLDRLMSRLGYAKLEQFGLELAHDGRVRSVHRTLHADGGGTPIVGWLTDDRGVDALPPWPPALPAPADDEWDAVITRARAKLDFIEEPATVLDAARTPAAIRASIVPPPPKPIPHVPRRAVPPPLPRRIAKGTEPHKAP